jgi:malonyl-CoA O-methyltransferase
MSRSHHVAQAFSKAAESYDYHTLIQKFVGQHLATKILSQEGPSLGTVLEIGCGTGILSQHLNPRSDHYVLSDISLSLLQQARKKLKGSHILPVVVDGELPCFTACFDVIVSNLVFHWLQDPKSALVRLVACLKPGGRLYLSTLGNNSLHEWRTAHMLCDAPCGILDFISYGQLKDWLPLSGIRKVEEEWISANPASALDLLRNLKGIGGTLPHPGHKPLPYKTLKKVMAYYDQNPQASYQILYGFYRKPEKMREE